MYIRLHEKKPTHRRSVTTTQTAFTVNSIPDLQSGSQTANKGTPTRPTPILGLIRPGNNSVYHARERRRAAGESRQHVNMLQRMTPKVMHGPCQAAFR